MQTESSIDDERADNVTESASTLFTFDSCSGGECCSEEDEECTEICEDKDELDLSSKAYDKCVGLAKETVEKLSDLFKNILKTPVPGDLEELEKEDLNLIGAALKELDSSLLLDHILKYNKSRAITVMEWLADNSVVFDVFKAAEDDDLKKMIVNLLDTAGGNNNSGDRGVLDGLSENVETDTTDDEQNIIALALDKGNEDLVLYIHNSLISDEDDEICEAGNHPAYDSNGGSSCTATEGTPADVVLEACILAAYCKIAPLDNEANNEFRKDIAEFLSEHRKVSQIRRFIMDQEVNGGLGLTDDDADAWTYAVCKRLKTCWQNGTLDLGLN